MKNNVFTFISLSFIVEFDYSKLWHQKYQEVHPWIIYFNNEHHQNNDKHRLQAPIHMETEEVLNCRFNIFKMQQICLKSYCYRFNFFYFVGI